MYWNELVFVSCVPNKANDVNVKVFDMITKFNKSKKKKKERKERKTGTTYM